MQEKNRGCEPMTHARDIENFHVVSAIKLGPVDIETFRKKIFPRD